MLLLGSRIPLIGSRSAASTKMRIVCAIAGMALLLGIQRYDVSAKTWNNAYSYYERYGNQVVFEPATQTDGTIYYATRGSVATSKITFRTLGWKVSILDSDRKSLQTVYFKLGGNYMYQADTVRNGNYKYNLYGVTLQRLRGRLTSRALQALDEGKASVRLDACMAVVKNGNVQGAMDDRGPKSGTVYTTYDGIVKAQYWSPSARNSLKSYFDKYVTGLFMNVQVVGEEGIQSVSGAGTYCYGTYLTVAAKLREGYEFAAWRGLLRSAEPRSGFYVGESGKCVASAQIKTLQIYYHRNWSKDDTVVEYRTNRYNREGMRLEAFSWQKAGKHMLGWAEQADAPKQTYQPSAKLGAVWMNARCPQVHLYAIWEKDKEPVKPPTEQPTDDTVKNEKEPTSTLRIRCRFISNSYYEDEENHLIPPERGGLDPDSIWATDRTRRQILRAALQRSSAQ